MTDVMRDKLCIIYALMHDDININIGAVIFSTMKKVHYYQLCRYRFGCLLTRFLRNHSVEEESLNYRPVVDTRTVDVSRTKGLTVAHGPLLTRPKCQACNDEIIAGMYRLQIL